VVVAHGDRAFHGTGFKIGQRKWDMVYGANFKAQLPLEKALLHLKKCYLRLKRRF